MPEKPNLFIIGAMKSGTTSLHCYLDQHPRIAMSVNKEPGYFVEELSWGRGESWYLNLFDKDPEYLYRGESSTHYTKLPRYRGVAERLHEFNPQARLIYIMRDPFDRLVSHYWHAVRDAGSGGEFRNIISAVTKTPDYKAFSNYALQLHPYIERFGRDSIHALTFESLVRDPQAALDRIFDWLNVKRHALGSTASLSHNRKPEEMQGVAGVGLLNRVQYSSTWDYVSPLIPRFAKQLAKRLAYRDIDESAATGEISELREVLRPIQQREIDALCRLLGREFPEWRSSSDSIRLFGTALPESV